MRLYLSSFRMGNHLDTLISLVKPGGSVAVIDNALDHLPLPKRNNYSENIYNIHDVFREIGLESHELDLRDYFHKPLNKLEEHLRKFDMIWVCGGNAFLLRRAMHQSGFDKILPKLLHEDAVAYGGWSAGVCVLGNTLQGIELCDDPHSIATGYDPAILWDGLKIIPYSVAPHYRSEHPETEMIEKCVEYFIENKIPYKTLRDGDVIVYNNSTVKTLLLEDGKPSELNLNISKRQS